LFFPPPRRAHCVFPFFPPGSHPRWSRPPSLFPELFFFLFLCPSTVPPVIPFVSLVSAASRFFFFSATFTLSALRAMITRSLLRFQVELFCYTTSGFFPLVPPPAISPTARFFFSGCRDCLFTPGGGVPPVPFTSTHGWSLVSPKFFFSKGPFRYFLSSQLSLDRNT